MVLESTIICVDNSEYTRNGDYLPTRLQAQQASYLCTYFSFRRIRIYLAANSDTFHKSGSPFSCRNNKILSVLRIRDVYPGS
jgi:hypothetical protein